MLVTIRLAAFRPSTGLFVSRYLSTVGASTTAANQPNLEAIKCISCGQAGHLARDCPKTSAEQKRKNAQDFFREGRCLICGEIGHVARACPTVGGVPDSSKPLEPKHERPSLDIRHGNKMCFQCGDTGHIMRDCPTAPYTKQIKGIRDRYRGSRLQKMLPEMLKEERTLEDPWVVFSQEKPELGVVVSTSSSKTIGVLLPRTVDHPLLKIKLDRSQKFMVHDEEEKAVCGDVVLIQRTRPISKKKHHALKEVILSLNERRANRAEKVAEFRQMYEGITEDALKELEEKVKRYEDRMTKLRGKEQEILAKEKQKINTDISERMKGLNEVLADVDERNETKNDEWLKAMQDKFEKADEWANERQQDLNKFVNYVAEKERKREERKARRAPEKKE